MYYKIYFVKHLIKHMKKMVLFYMHNVLFLLTQYYQVYGRSDEHPGIVFYITQVNSRISFLNVCHREVVTGALSKRRLPSYVRK